MNDVLSLGIHRCWKGSFVSDIGCLRQDNNDVIRVLDVAGGTGDIAFKILE
jgi:ubiquinone/menaquinone biosynthesis C-methylase UbiE